MNIQGMCKAKVAALGMTYPELSEKSGIPLPTIRNFFSKASKAPSVYTVGPICAVLGISLDEVFAITDHLTPTEEMLSAKNDTLQAHREELEHRLENKRETIDMLKRGVKLRNHIIFTLGWVCIGLMIWCLWVDIHCANYGFWKW